MVNNYAFFNILVHNIYLKGFIFPNTIYQKNSTQEQLKQKTLKIKLFYIIVQFCILVLLLVFIQSTIYWTAIDKVDSNCYSTVSWSTICANSNPFNLYYLCCLPITPLLKYTNNSGHTFSGIFNYIYTKLHYVPRTDFLCRRFLRTFTKPLIIDKGSITTLCVLEIKLEKKRKTLKYSM